MSAPICLICARPTDGWVCSGCADKARTDLDTIADIAAAARAVAHGQTCRGVTPGGGTGKPGSRIELNLPAGARIDSAINTLTTWVRHVAAERGHPPAPSTGPVCALTCGHGSCASVRADRDPEPLAFAARWLAPHTQAVRHWRESVDAYRDIAAVRRLLEALTNGPGERRWLGQCDTETGAGRCTVDLYARPGATYITCRGCGTRHEVAELRAWLDDQVRGFSYTPAEIEQAYGIPAETIRTWAHRREITATGEVDGRPIYPLGAVLDLAAAKAARREERRAKAQRRAQEAAQNERETEGAAA